MPRNARGHRRARDQGPVVEKRDPLVCDRDDDLERALRSGLGPGFRCRFRICLPVVVPVFEPSVMVWPERVPGPEQKLSVCGFCREYENDEYRRRYCADGSGVDASGGRCGHGAHSTVQAFPRGAMLAIPARTSPGCTGTIWSFRDDACEAGAWRALTRHSDRAPPRFESIRVIRRPRLRIQGIAGLLRRDPCGFSIGIRLCRGLRGPRQQ